PATAYRPSLHDALPIDGIIVADKATLDRARTHLASSRPLPAAAVLVTTTEAMENASTQPGTGFVVEPTPALHDPVAAARAREQRSEEHTSELQSRENIV